MQLVSYHEACILIAYQERHYIQWKCSVLLVVSSFFAEIFLVHLHFELIKRGYGLLIVIIALSKLFLHKQHHYPVFLNILILLSAGVIHGLFLSGGAILVIYLMRCDLSVSQFRSTIACIWIFLRLILAVTQGITYGYTPVEIHLSILSIIPALASYKCGHFLIRYIKGHGFYVLTDILLILSGMSSLVL